MMEKLKMFEIKRIKDMKTNKDSPLQSGSGTQKVQTTLLKNAEGKLD
jgi:hypothetical protein